jgi:hypothetical protein
MDQRRKIDHFFFVPRQKAKIKIINTPTENEHYFDEPDYPVRTTQKRERDYIGVDRDE